MAETVVVQPNSDNSSGAAWFALAIIVVALVVGGLYFYRHTGARTPAGATINVTLPTTGGSGTTGQ